MATGHLRHLQELSIGGTRIPVSIMSSFAGLIAENALPMLEILTVGSCEKGGVVALMHSLRGGACPHLHDLDMEMVAPRFYWSKHEEADERDWLEDPNTPDVEQSTCSPLLRP